MSDTSPAGSEGPDSTADDAKFARDRIEEIENEAVDDVAAIEDADTGLSLEEAVGQARPDVEGTPGDQAPTK